MENIQRLLGGGGDRGGGEEEEDTVVNNEEGVGEFEKENGPELIDNISPFPATHTYIKLTFVKFFFLYFFCTFP